MYGNIFEQLTVSDNNKNMVEYRYSRNEKTLVHFGEHCGSKKIDLSRTIGTDGKVLDGSVTIWEASDIPYENKEAEAEKIMEKATEKYIGLKKAQNIDDKIADLVESLEEKLKNRKEFLNAYSLG